LNVLLLLGYLYFRRWDIFNNRKMMFFMESMKVASNAKNQQVDPFLPMSLGSKLIKLSLDKIERLSKNQYNKKPNLVSTLSAKSYFLIELCLAKISRSFPYYFKLLNNLNNFLASLIAQNKASIFF
jgi:hypothetical protein